MHLTKPLVTHLAEPGPRQPTLQVKPTLDELEMVDLKSLSRVFLSSTISDLRHFRKEAERVIAWSGATPELVGPLTGLSEEEVVAECRRLVETCSLCVLIAGRRSGGRIVEHSFTSHEIVAADEAEIPVLAFLVDAPSDGDSSECGFVGLDEQEWVARFKKAQLTSGRREEVLVVESSSAGLESFRLMLMDRLHRFVN